MSDDENCMIDEEDPIENVFKDLYNNIAELRAEVLELREYSKNHSEQLNELREQIESERGIRRSIRFNLNELKDVGSARQTEKKEVCEYTKGCDTKRVRDATRKDSGGEKERETSCYDPITPWRDSSDSKPPEPSPCCENCIKKGQTLDYCYLYHRRCPYDERNKEDRLPGGTGVEPREDDYNWIDALSKLNKELRNGLKAHVIESENYDIVKREDLQWLYNNLDLSFIEEFGENHILDRIMEAYGIE